MTGTLPLGQELQPPGCLRLREPLYGIDPSTLRVAVAVLIPNGDEAPAMRFDILSLPRVDGPARMGAAFRSLEPWFRDLEERWGTPRHVFVEQPFAKGRNVHPSSQQMVGVVLAAVGVAVPSARLGLIAPASWKMRALGEGHGHAEKPEIMEWARAQGYDRAFQDEADALGVATAGGVIVSGGAA
jgi:Holliday junction resolvasome RuvABC endonuclease subunit